MPLNKDSLPNTFLVATTLCLTCALIVSAASVTLRPLQLENAQRDRRNNILQVSGFTPEEIKEDGGIKKVFESRFDVEIIDLDTGADAQVECQDAMNKAKDKEVNLGEEYDQLWASKLNPEKGLSEKLDKKADLCGIKSREKYSEVFIMKSLEGKPELYVFPVRGNGLWSLMQGYLAVKPDFQTVVGLTFYQQAETPGLGGEVQNPDWKALWKDKKIYDDGEVKLAVIKGNKAGNDYGVDALSGATITSNGVTNMIDFWMGSKGFGPYIEKMKNEDSSNTNAAAGGNNVK
ncbi:MAG: Na(+)-translocating NADH-quinone reductase subunit C [Mariniblastus sp.]|nr:Na(+)-translocating NADH-quinone reductase subunit C [Mariniblastus sp.]MDG2183429.1 Na(+)-translocating NADH-quinone reductase subunit C [Mariniblastus sp.]